MSDQLKSLISFQPDTRVDPVSRKHFGSKTFCISGSVYRSLGTHAAELRDTVIGCLSTELLIRHYLEMRDIDFHYAVRMSGRGFCYRGKFGELPALDQMVTQLLQEIPDARTLRSRFPALLKQLVSQLQSACLGCRDDELSYCIEMELGSDTVAEEFQLHAYGSRPDRACSAILDMAEAVRAAHAVGLMICDLKPDNFLYCTRNGQRTLVLNDFDAAALVPPGAAAVNYLPGCTPEYASPEQVDVYTGGAAGQYGFASDVFAVSLIAYRLMNGGLPPVCLPPPHNAVSRRQHFEALKAAGWQIEPPAAGSPAMKQAILQGMSLDPNARGSLLRLAQAAEQKDAAAAPAPTSVQVQIQVPSQTAGMQQESNRHAEKSMTILGDNIRKIVAMLLAFFVVLAGVLFLLLRKPADRPDNSLSAPPVTDETTTASETTTQITTETNAETTVPPNAVTTAAVQQPQAVPDKPQQNVSGGGNTIVVITPPQNDTPAAVTTAAEEPVVTTTTTTCFFQYRPVSYTLAYKNAPDQDIVTGLEITGLNGTFSGAALAIPEEIDGQPVVGIGDSAFRQIWQHGGEIVSLSMPSVQYIGDSAFAGICAVSSLDLTHVRYLGANAFENCPRIQTVSLSAGLTYIGSRCFWDDGHHDRLFVYPDTDSALRMLVAYNLKDYPFGADETYTIATERAFY